jgi:hypothetical protein
MLGAAFALQPARRALRRCNTRVRAAAAGRQHGAEAADRPLAGAHQVTDSPLAMVVDAGKKPSSPPSPPGASKARAR